MRLKEEIERSGHFWLPSNPDRKVPGKLTIFDGGRIELEILGLFDESIEALEHFFDGENTRIERIFGYVEKDGLVTLCDCFYLSKNISFGALSKSRILASTAIFGIHYEDKVITINTLQFSIEGIDEWVGITGIDVKVNLDERTSTINYKPPQEISIGLGNGLKLIISFSYTIPGFPILKQAKITQKIYLKLVSCEERTIDEMISVAHKITTLVSFATSQNVSIEDIQARSKRFVHKDGKSKQFSLFYQSHPFSADKPKIDINRMLFRYPQINTNPEMVFQNWFKAYETIRPTIELYFSAVHGGYSFIDGKFLALAQAMESYHRRTSDETVMPEEDYKQLCNVLVANCPKPNRKWLSEKLKYGNEISLSKRIKSIIEPFEQHIGTSKNVKKMIRKIVDTRNYLTHYDESLKSKAAHGREFLDLCQKMEAIIQLHLLKLLGFGEEQIKEVLENNLELNYKLK